MNSRLRTIVPPASTYGRGDDREDRSIALEGAERVAIIADRRLCYVRAGPLGSATILFLPGLGATWRAWTSTIRGLASTFDCVAIDIPGFGRSERPSDGMAIKNVSRTISAFIDIEVGRPVWVVAHSLGGLVATDLQSDHDVSVRGLALVSGVFPVFLEGFRKPSILIRRPLQYGTAALAMVASSLPLRSALAHAIRRSPAFRRVALGPFVQRPIDISPEAAGNLAVGGSVMSVAGVLRNGFGYDYLKVLGLSSAPLIIHGSNDRLSTRADVESLLKLNGTADVVEIRGAKHVAMIEYPHLVNDLIMEWVGSTR